MAVLVDIGVADAASALALSSYLADRFRSTSIGVARFNADYIIVGLYKAIDSGHDRVYRRLTGGPTFPATRNGYWLSIVFAKSHSLKELSEFAQCLTGFYGVTRFAGRALVEAFIEARTLDLGMLTYCGREAGIGRLVVDKRERADMQYLTAYATRFRSTSWRLYRFHRGSAYAVTQRGSYYARISVEVVDGYIADWWVDGVFNAAPPMEIYSVLASVKGSPFHELTLFNIELALKTRVELHGISVEDFISAIRRLYSSVGMRFYEEKLD